MTISAEAGPIARCTVNAVRWPPSCSNSERSLLNPFTHRRILKNGRTGKAVITRFSSPERGTAKQNLSFTLEVHVEGSSPYIVKDQWMVSSRDTIGFGVVLPVKVDHGNPQRVAIDWKAARNMRQSERDQRADALASQPIVGPDPDPTASPDAAVIDASNDPELRAKLEQALGRSLGTGTRETLDVSNDPMLAQRLMGIVDQHQAGAAGSTTGEDDVIGKLERLARLSDSGALTDAEFEEQTARLPGPTRQA